MTTLTVNRLLRWLATLVVLAGVVLGGSWWVQLGFADEEPERVLEIFIPVTQTTWWLANWSDSQIRCTITADRDGFPTHNEVYYACGEDLYDDWVATPPCNFSASEEEKTPCEGLYLFLVSTQPGERTIKIDLPHPAITLTLEGCSPTPPDNRCANIPDLVLTGEEPLPNESISAIHVNLEGEVFDCEGEICYYPLPITSIDGAEIEFWAESSFGDSTDTYTALIRAVDGGVDPNTGEQFWYIDVISSQWRGDAIASCAGIWETLPPVGGPPAWLSTPARFEDLATDAPFVWLAGRLITQGAVDASTCPAGGLLENGHANTCGLQVARGAVNDWQDQFDATIYTTALETNVPAQLLKNLFSVESQFWPGIWLPEEFGLGQLTELGTDAALLWNPTFFDEFCPLVLDAGVCSEGYLSLKKEEQNMLRGALTAQTDSTCIDCPLGIDLSHAEFSVDVFANTILGNCEQAGRVVRNTTGKAPGETTSYEDMWRFTLVNYNGGSGCLSSAALVAWSKDRALDWDTLSTRLDQVCQNTISYVEQVEMAGIRTVEEVEPTPTAEIGPTPTPTSLPGAPYPVATSTPPYP